MLFMHLGEYPTDDRGDFSNRELAKQVRLCQIDESTLLEYTPTFDELVSIFGGDVAVQPDQRLENLLPVPASATREGPRIQRWAIHTGTLNVDRGTEEGRANQSKMTQLCGRSRKGHIRQDDECASRMISSAILADNEVYYHLLQTIFEAIWKVDDTFRMNDKKEFVVIGNNASDPPTMQKLHTDYDLPRGSGSEGATRLLQDPRLKPLFDRGVNAKDLDEL